MIVQARKRGPFNFHRKDAKYAKVFVARKWTLIYANIIIATITYSDMSD